jgi:hypothetical protein
LVAAPSVQPPPKREVGPSTAAVGLVPVKAYTGFLKRPSGAMIAPLSIKTAPGFNYFVRLVDEASRKHETEIFIIGGQPFSVKIPLGQYRLRYASGSTWYGEKLRFGPNTSYTEALQSFAFQRTRNGVQGYTVELIAQAGGNLPTQPISADRFDN